MSSRTRSSGRAELHVVTSRANTGGPQAVQWSLPPPAATLTIGR
jgi:hypothetical protein